MRNLVEGGEGIYPPVTGLLIATLKKHITGLRRHLPDNSQLGILSHNGPCAIIVTAPLRALCGLVIASCKICVPSGLDRSKSLFQQRKAVFTVRFFGPRSSLPPALRMAQQSNLALVATSRFGGLEDIWLYRLITGHIQLRQHLHRLQAADSPMCEHCKTVTETVAHFMLRCPLYSSERYLNLESLGIDYLVLEFLFSLLEALLLVFDYVRATGRFSDFIR